MSHDVRSIFRFRSTGIFLLVVAAFLSGAGSAAAAPPGPDPEITLFPAERPLQFDTNLGLVERATNEAVEEALAGLRLDPGSKIRLHALTNHEASWFVEDVIARFLSDRGYQVHLVPREKKSADTPAGPASGGADGSGASSLAEAMARSKGTGPSTPDAAADNDTPPAGGPESGDGTAETSDDDPAETSDDDPAETSGGAPAEDVANAPEATAGSPPGPRAAQGPGRKPGPGALQGTVDPEEPDPSEVIPIPEGEGLVLTFRLIQFGVTYHDSWRRGFMGPRVIERLASVNLFTRLVSGSAENILWVGQGKSEKLDIVPQAKIDLLEGMSYPFRKPEIRQKPLSRFLEPVLVSSIIGGLVFLFYTNQD